jgi:hypothetical protein
MGRPQEARALWLASSKFKSWKPKKLVPVPMPTVEINEDAVAELAAAQKAEIAVKKAAQSSEAKTSES